MQNEIKHPTILATYPNKTICFEYPDGSRADMSTAQMKKALHNTELSYKFVKHDYLYKSTVFISITSLCNCHCVHCFEGDEDGNMSGSFSLEQISKILDESYEIGIRNVELTGGEPLMHPEFKSILRLIKEKGMRCVSVFTNGLLINEALLSYIKELELHPVFRISFDGLGTHDSFRGVPGMEKKIIENMQLVKKAGFSLCCNINVNRITLHTIMDTVRFAATVIGADIYLIRTSPSPRWVKTCGEATLTYEEYYDTCLDVIKTDIQEKWGVNIRMLHMPTIPADLNMKPVFDAWHSGATCAMTKPLISHCPKANYIVSIAHDGRVLPCDGFSGYSDKNGFLTGDDINILKRPLKDILTDSEYRRIYDITLNDLTKAEPDCLSCKWLYICKGGCRLLSVGEGSALEFDRKSKPNCAFFKDGYAEKLEELFKQ